MRATTFAICIFVAAGMEPFARNTKNFETDTKKPEGASMAEGAVHALKSWVWGSGEEVKKEEKHARESGAEAALPPTLPPQPLHEPHHDGRETTSQTLPTEPPPAKMGTEPLQVEANSQEASLDDLTSGASLTEEQSHLASLKEQEAALHKENAELEAEAARLEEENKSMEGKAELASLEQERADLQAEADRLEKEGHELEAAAGKALSKEQMDRLMNMSEAELEEEVKKLQAQAAEYNAERDRVASENEALLKEVKEMEALKAARGKGPKALLSDGGKEGSVLETDAEALSAAELQELEDLQGTNAALAEKIHAQDTENEHLKERVKELEEKQAAHERMVALEAKATADDAEKAALKARIAELEKAQGKSSMEVAADGQPVRASPA